MRTASTLRAQTELWLVLLLLASGETALANTPLFNIQSGNLGGSTINLGYSFSLNHGVVVTGLAKHDANRNGVLDDLTDPQIGLWNTLTRELIAMAEIDDQSVFRDGMFVAPIGPIELPAGRYTVATQYFRGEEPFLRNAVVQQTAAEVGGLRPVHGAGDPSTMPTSGVILGFGPNLLIDEPTIQLTEPRASSVTQRRPDNTAVVPVAGAFDAETVSTIEVRAVSMSGQTRTETAWRPADVVGNTFTSEFVLPAGEWFEVQARGFKEGLQTAENAVPNVGVGEVFVIAGQSNSANHGEPRQETSSGRVMAMDSERFWGPAIDPLPTATGAGGSPWPIFGDLLVEALDVPVGIVSVGWGGTAVSEWLPDAHGPDRSGPLYNRLKSALESLGPNGARAVLWHQGEEDAARATSQDDYAAALAELIGHSRTDAGYEVPWGIAQAAFLPTNSSSAERDIRAGQRAVIAGDTTVFAGPLTDDLIGDPWRYDGIHFNEVGLSRHAQMWADIVLQKIVPEPACSSLLLVFVIFLLAQRSAGT